MAITMKPKQPASRAVPASPKPLNQLASRPLNQQIDPRNGQIIVTVETFNQRAEPSTKFDKTAYQRELMRQRRAADRDAGLVNVKLPADLVAKFKATGPGWQARMNDVLAAAIPPQTAG